MPLFARFFVLVILPAGIVTGLGYSLTYGSNSWQHLGASRARLAAAQEREAELSVEIAALRREVDQLRNDEASLRRAAAEELLLVPSGSTVYRFVAGSATPQ